MSKNLNNKWEEFIQNHDPNEVSRNLRNVFLDCIEFWSNQGLPIDFNIQLMRFNALFELLDLAADEKMFSNKRGQDGSNGN